MKTIEKMSTKDVGVKVVKYGSVFLLIGVLFFLGARGCSKLNATLDKRTEALYAEGKIVDVASFHFDGSKLTVFREGKSAFIALSPQVVNYAPNGFDTAIRPLKEKNEVHLKFKNNDEAMKFRDELREKADEVGAISGPMGVDYYVFVF